jgi:hypothetical protein
VSKSYLCRLLLLKRGLRIYRSVGECRKDNVVFFDISNHSVMESHSETFMIECRATVDHRMSRKFRGQKHPYRRGLSAFRQTPI